MMSSPFVGFTSFFKKCKDKYPDFCHECPLMPGNIALNLTDDIGKAACPKVTNRNMPTIGAGKWFPDGDYKGIFRISTAQELALTVNYYFKIKNGDTKPF